MVTMMVKSAKYKRPGMLTLLKEQFLNYLKESSIHGLRYVAERPHWWEKTLWILIINFSFLISAGLIGVGLHETYTEPILTTIDTTTVKNVPFPAITIRGDGDVNPWGFVEKVLNMLAFMCIDDKDPASCQESAELRTTFQFLLKAIIDEMKTHIDEWADPFTLQMIKDYPNDDQGNIKQILSAKLDDSAIKLAALMIKDNGAAKDAFEEIMDNFEEAFPRVLSYKMVPFAMSSMKPVIDKYFDQIEPTTEYETCKAENQSCYNQLKSAYVQLYLPFLINKIPNKFMGFGNYLSYFTRLVTKSKIGVFLSNTKPSANERTIRDYLARILNNMAGSDYGGISVYELVNLVQRPPDWNRYTPAPYLQQKQYDCSQKQMEDVYDHWKDLIEDSNSRTGALHSPDYVNEPPCTNLTHAEKEKYEGCCNFLRHVHDKLESTLKVMKYAQQPPHFYDSLDEIAATFGNGSILEYNTLLNKSQTLEYVRSNFNPLVMMCRYAGQPETMTMTGCDLFRRSITNEGIGYTFNQAKFWDTYKDNDYNQMFARVMFPKGYNESGTHDSNIDGSGVEDDSQRWVYPQEGVLFPETSGPAYGLTAVLQGIRIMDPDPKNSDIKPYKPFKVSIHDPLTIADLRSTGVEVEPGYLSTFLITPSQIVTSPTVMGLEESRRGCRFKDETQDLVIFKEYTQVSCTFECQIKQAFEKCGCIPWDYPHLGEPRTVCDLWGRYCFESFIGDTSTAENCDCPYDCATTRYAYSVSSTALDIDAMCNDKSEFKKDLSSEKRALPPMFIRRYEQVTRGYDIGLDAICKKNIKGVAIVKFQLANKIITRIKKNLRVTFADQLSNIGGTLGLFTGVSIISCFEAIFWIFRLPGRSSSR